MATIEERIIVSIEALSKGFNQTFNQLQKNFQGLNQVLTASNQQFRDMSTRTGELNSRLKNMNNPLARVAFGFRKATAGLRGFRMELLGVLFFGMAMQNMFMSLLRPAADVFGIFELWTTTLQVFFLPIMEEIFPHLLNLMDVLMNMDPATQKIVGGIVALGVALGSIFLLLGQLALGIGALFGTSFPVLVAEAILLLGNLLRVFAGIPGLIVGLFASIIIAWNEDFRGFRNNVQTWVLSVVGIFTGAIDQIKNLWQAMIALITGDFDTASEKFLASFESYKDFIKSLKDFTVSTFEILGKAILRTLEGVINAAISIVNAFLPKDLELERVNFDRTPEATAGLNVGQALLGPVPGLPQQFTITNNFNGFTNDELNRKIDENNRDMVDTVLRQTGTKTS